MNDDMKELQAVVGTQSRSSNHPTAVARSRRSDSIDTSGNPADAQMSTNAEAWAVYGGRNYVVCDRVENRIPAGQYTIDYSDALGVFFHKEDVMLDELLVLPDSKSELVIQEIQRFWTLENRYREYGFLWKRGVLLWGPPGSGKTSTLQIISDNIIRDGGIAVYVDNPDLAAKALKRLRQVEPSRPLIIMLEDIDTIVYNYGESDLLALMDGELQIDNVVYVATTNYPEKLDKRLVNRPSRFDIVKKIGMPSADARGVYLKTKNPKLDNEQNAKALRQWVAATDGFSIAHLKELIIAVEVLGQPFDEAIARLKSMSNEISSSSGTGAFGFSGRANDD